VAAGALVDELSVVVDGDLIVVVVEAALVVSFVVVYAGD
jgi:hypothetical protein